MNTPDFSLKQIQMATEAITKHLAELLKNPVGMARVIKDPEGNGFSKGYDMEVLALQSLTRLIDLNHQIKQELILLGYSYEKET